MPAIDVDAVRVLQQLTRLRELTGDDRGAQRVCWTPGWRGARQWLLDELASLPVEVHSDSAGNCWATLPGRRAEAIILGSHLDSVPDGGWLDGALGVVAGLEILRALCRQGTPQLTVRLVDWADEEGVSFGEDSLGARAAAGTLDVRALDGARHRDGRPIEEALGQEGLSLERLHEARTELDDAVAYVELHIEQGPVLEAEGLPLAAVLGTVGVVRSTVTFTGQAAHAGATPMAARRDPVAAAARFALATREQAQDAGALATIGSVSTRPGIPTVVAAECELTLDLRHLDGKVLSGRLDRAKATASRIAAEEDVVVAWRPGWGIEPIAFDERLVAVADDAIREVAGVGHRMPSGPLHDAAEIQKAGVPSVMLFVQSLGGLSHTAEEDTRPEHLMLAVHALALIVRRLLDDPVLTTRGPA